MRTQRAKVVGWVLVLAVVLAACGSAPTSMERQASYEVEGAAPVSIAPSAPGEGEMSGGTATDSVEESGGDNALAQAQATNRKIIYDVNLQVRFQDVQAAAEQIKALATSHGGYVVTANITQATDDQYSGTMTLRVDATRLDDAVAAIKALGTATFNEQVSTTDVTDEYVDLTARIDNLERTETELQLLLTEIRENSRKAEEVLTVYRELTQLREEIERIEARRKTLDTLTALATINLSLIPPSVIVTNPGWSLGSVFEESLSDLVSGLQSVAEFTTRLLVTWVPLFIIWLLPLAIIFFLVRAVWRRMRAVPRPPEERVAPPAS